MTTSFSLRNTTRKYGIIVSIMAGMITEPVSSTRETSDAPAA